MTTKEWLTEIGSSSSTTEIDESIMVRLLQKISFPHAKIVCGIVYLEGKGTMEAPPMPMQSVAKMILSCSGV